MEPGLDVLNQLRDIHAPPAVAWWPPAPGWWALLGVVLLTAVLLVVFYRRRHRRPIRGLRNDALAELARIQNEFQRDGDVTRLTAQLSILLRRTAVARNDRTDVAGLSGEAWLRYLDETSQGQAFSLGPGQALVTAPYQAHVDVNPHALVEAVSVWIRQSSAARVQELP